MKKNINIAMLFAALALGGCLYGQKGEKQAIVTDDEIGDKGVVEIKQTLKDPFLTLLASSEFTTKEELSSRIEAADKALEKIKAIFKEDKKVEQVAEKPVETAPIPVSVPTPVEAPKSGEPSMGDMSMPAPMPVAASTPMPTPEAQKPSEPMMGSMPAPVDAPASMPISEAPKSAESSMGDMPTPAPVPVAIPTPMPTPVPVK